MEATAALTLDGGPDNPARARRFVVDYIRRHAVDCDEWTAELLTSELVTNAVLYAGGGIEVSISAGPTSLRVEVRDRSSRLPAAKHWSEETTIGRGLPLVDRLADDWGAYTLESRTIAEKVVWFELGTSAS